MNGLGKLAHLGRLKPGEHHIETSVGVVTTTLNADGSVSAAAVGQAGKHMRREGSGPHTE